MTGKVDLAYAMQLAPADAIDYFKSKGYAIGFNWYDVQAEANAKAFTVSGVLKLDILADIQNGLAPALNDAIRSATLNVSSCPCLSKRAGLVRGWLPTRRPANCGVSASRPGASGRYSAPTFSHPMPPGAGNSRSPTKRSAPTAAGGGHGLTYPSPARAAQRLYRCCRLAGVDYSIPLTVTAAAVASGPSPERRWKRGALRYTSRAVRH